MQPRLTRSNSERMIAGVCGGLGEYFNVDPVIVRLIFVLVTLTSGMGLIIYPLLWILMPLNRYSSSSVHAQAPTQPDATAASQFEQSQVYAHQTTAQYQQTRGGIGYAGDEAGEYRFDPVSGQPLPPQAVSTGDTINLRIDNAEIPTQYTPHGAPQQYQAAPARRRRNWRTLGCILIGIGGLMMLQKIGIDMSIVFPILLILAGVLFLRRRR